LIAGKSTRQALNEVSSEGIERLPEID